MEIAIEKAGFVNILPIMPLVTTCRYVKIQKYCYTEIMLSFHHGYQKKSINNGIAIEKSGFVNILPIMPLGTTCRYVKIQKYS